MKVEGLSVGFREGGQVLVALDRVNLELEGGRVVGLVGESGSGKTTLGKSLMGLLAPNALVEGSIRLDERELVGLDETSLNALRWSRVAMVSQAGGDLEPCPPGCRPSG